MTRIVKCLEICHERNVSVILCSRKWWCLSLKDASHPWRGLRAPSDYLKTCHVRLGSHIFWVVPEGKLGLMCCKYKNWFPLYMNKLLQQLELLCQLSCWCQGSWGVGPWSTKVTIFSESLNGLSHLWLKNCMTICHSPIVKWMKTKSRSAFLSLALVKSILGKNMLLEATANTGFLE